MPAPKNRFKQALKEGRPQIGLWQALANAYTVEICADAGYDWLLLDAEHAPNDVPLLVSALRPTAYRLAGELADGAIAWVTPPAFLRDVAGPALRDSTAAHGRPQPRLVGHAFALVTSDPAEATAADEAGDEDDESSDTLSSQENEGEGSVGERADAASLV